jgi:hypothetical protein
MAFVLKQSDNYSWPVTVEIPIDGGRFEKHTFDAQFKRLSQTRIEEIMSEAISGEMKDVAVATDILTGWTGITGDGEPIPYSEKGKADLLDMPLVASSIVKSWMESLAGARKKN